MNNPGANHGFVAKLVSETYNRGGMYWEYRDPNYQTTGQKPYLAVTYTPAPSAPAGVTAAARDSAMAVTWSAPSLNGGSGLTKYTVQAYQDATNQAVGAAVTTCSTCTSATITGLANNTGYYAKVTATNADNLTGAAGVSNAVYPGAAPRVSKIAMSDTGTTITQASRGQTVTYRITVTNPDSAYGLATTTVKDTIPAGLKPQGTALRLGGAACTSTTYPSCVLNGQTLTISGLQVAASSSKTIDYQAIAVGSDRTCTTITNAVTATNTFGAATASAPLGICDGGLGLEPWWNYIERSAGPQALASINVGSGNLVLQQTDSTPVQAHGDLAFVLRRTYNSSDTTALTLPGSVGGGWQLNIGQTDDLAAAGVGSTGLVVPPLSQALAPLAVTLVDRDGTRHVFTHRSLNLPVDVTALQAAAVNGDPGALGTLTPHTLTLDAGYTRLCVDQTYDAPPGVHLALWRYIAVAGTSCASPLTVPSPPKVIGFAAVRPDRLRYEYTFDGRMTSMIDASGVELRYTYAANTALGSPLSGLQSVYEPRSCPGATVTAELSTLPATCRAFRITYPTTTQVQVSDPAGRTTSYTLDGAVPISHLTQVANPDGTTLNYTYGGCGGTADQLCTATDPRGGLTKLTYGAAPALGRPRVTAVTDRRGSTTTLSYSSNPDTVTADLGARRQRFSGIDSTGRVGQVDEGDTSGTLLRQTLYTWDQTGTTCRQPDNAVDNNLCHLVRKSLTSATADEDTSFRYNPEGRTLLRRQENGTAPSISTDGFRATYVEADGTTRQFTDSVTGNGAVTSSGTSRVDAGTLFAVSDRTESLTPRGNAAGTGYAAYRTTYQVDNNPAVAVGAVPNANPCTTPTTPTSNTGSICQVTAPAYDSNGHAAVTANTYNTFGEKLTTATPKANADALAGQAPATVQYTYYADTDLDLSANVSAGGWLKAVTDQTGRFVAFGYDRAGNKARSWDRNATNGHRVDDFPGLAAVPTNNQYTETLHATGSQPLSAPWRYVRSTRDPLGNTTTTTVDANGNPTVTRSPRGNAAGNGTYDTVRTFDAGDLLLTVKQPAETTTTSNTYDASGNRTAVTDARGNTTVTYYDPVSRSTGTAWTQGPWPADTSTVPPACRQSTTSDAPLPTGRILCRTQASYDGVDNITSVSDGNAQVTTYLYDALHRKTRTTAPRNDGTLTTLRTDTTYDPDGNVLDVCPPREFTEGLNTCTVTAPYSTHNTYDTLDRPATSTTYRQHDATSSPPVYDALTTRRQYDADGNPTATVDPRGNTWTATYNTLDRKTASTAPRNTTAGNTTSYTYDGVGNLLSTTDPEGGITAYSYDADNRLVDTVTGATTTDATVITATSTDGGSNTRTRLYYDADSNIVGQSEPRSADNLLTGPDTWHMTRVDLDPDGRPTAIYQPRYDTGADTSDVGLSPEQSQNCRTSTRPAAVTGVPAYPATTAVCVTTLQYDPNGNRAKVTYPTSTGTDNRYSTYSYSDDNRLTVVNAPAPANDTQRVTTTMRYDGDGRGTSQTDPLGQTTAWTYNADGTLAAVQAPSVNGSPRLTRYVYDAAGNLTRTSRVTALATGTTAETAITNTASYYTDNTVRDQTDGAGDTTRYQYDPNGNPTDVYSPSAVAKDTTNPAGAPTRNQYTADNLLAATLTPITGDGTRLRRTDMGYDRAGRKTSTASREVAASSPTVTLTGRDGGTQTLAYYPNDRLKTQTGRDNSTITDTYDPSGNLTSAADSSNGGNTVTATYYLDNLLRTVNDGSRTSQYAYDGAGHRTARADSTITPSVTRYAYNAAQLPGSITSDATGGRTTILGYDNNGRPVRETVPNGTTRNLSYNPDDTVARSTLTAGSTTLADWTYTYDPLQRITSQAYTGTNAATGSAVTGSQIYAYDNADRLTSWTSPTNGTASTITYDHDGNRTALGAQKFTDNPDDTIATSTDSAGANTKTNTYTAYGAVADDGAQSNCYDGFDRLATVAASGSATCATGVKTRYAYDGLDRQRTHTSTTAVGKVPANTTVTAQYDGLSSTLAAEAAPGLADTSYELGPDGLPWAVTGPNPAGLGAVVQFLSDDGQGDVTTAVDTAGALACAARFDPWGSPLNPRSADNSCSTGATPNIVGYRGARRDATTGQYQFGSRTYDPGRAGFLTADSYRTGGSQANTGLGVDPLTRNSYAYVNGDPVNLADPSGHRFEASDRGSEADGMPYAAPMPQPAPQPKAKPKKHHWYDNYVKGVVTVVAVAGAVGTCAVAEAACGTAVGAAIGASVAVWSCDTIDAACAREVAAGTAGGAVAGATFGLAAGAEATGGALVAAGALSGATGSVAQQVVATGKVDLKQAAVSAAVGGVTAGLGEKLAPVAKRAGQAVSRRLANLRTVGDVHPPAVRPAAAAPVRQATQDAGGGSTGSATETAAGSCSVNSFTAGTPVLMADGHRKPIEQVQVGDLVVATDPETGVTAARPVDRLIQHSGQHVMVALTLADGSTINATDHHPFWTSNTARFTDAIDLHLGDTVLEPNGNLLPVASAQTYSTDITAYNLSITGIHTYYAGSTPVLVHNTCGSEPYLDRHNNVTNGAYTIDAEGMSPHLTGSTTSGKSQFLFSVDASRAVLDAASYADEAGLWSGPKAKVFVDNGPVGVLGESGELTSWLNVYRTRTGFVHGAPGGAP